MNRLRVLGLVLGMVLLTATLGLTSTAEARVDEMSESSAGNYYLKSACDQDAYERFAIRVFGPDNRIRIGEVRRRLPEIKRLTTAYANEEYNFGRRLLNPPAPWPAVLGNLPDKMAAKRLDYALIRRKQGAALTGAGWLRLNENGNDFNFGNFAAEIRAILNLPPPGKGC